MVDGCSNVVCEVEYNRIDLLQKGSCCISILDNTREVWKEKKCHRIYKNIFIFVWWAVGGRRDLAF